MRKLLVSAVVFACTTSLLVFAQGPPAVSTAPAPRSAAVEAQPGGKVVIGPDGKPVMIDGPDGPAGKPGEQEKAPAGMTVSPRFNRLKTLAFDRRPSAMLKAWAPKPPSDKPAPVKDPKVEALDKEITEFTKNVTLGNWAAVKTYIASLPDEEAILAYKQLLTSLQRNPGMPQGGPGGQMPDGMMEGMPPGMMNIPGVQQYMEKNAFTVDDLLGLAAAAPAGPNATQFPARAAAVGSPLLVLKAPTGIEKDHLSSLTSVLNAVINGGTLPEVVVARFKAEMAKPEGASPFTKRQMAKLLIQGQPAYAGDFLPTPEEAQKAGDLEALNLLARHFLALHGKEKKSNNLERAWAAVQAILATSEGKAEEKQEGLVRAVELAPRIKEELGQAWLDASFTKDTARGMEILATIGTLVSQGISSKPFAPDDRLNALKLMQTAVEALLKAAPDRAKEWKPTLTLLASGWLKEAEFSQRFDRSSGSGPRLRRDMYGNIFFAGDDDEDPMMRMMMQQRPDMPRPVTIIDVVKARPNEAWIAAIDDTLRPKLADVLARLHLKISEEDKAFPLIETLATAQPDDAKELVKEFLRVWTRNHDPNANRYANRYSWFFYGFETRAESIPLTRSKQERNLTELSEWVARMKKLPGGAGDLDDDLLVKAFTACHSSAEVYKTEAIEAVFGSLGSLKPKTLAGLANQMRTNLAGLWKDPGEQQQKKTNRKKKDIEAEVLRGYAVARGVIADGLKKFPDHWALLAAEAGVIHDEVNYRQELAKASDFSAKRSEAFALYQKAAAQYAKDVKALPEDEHNVTVFEAWFAAALGAVDLGMITEEKQPDWKQPPLIKAALMAIPGDLAQKHLDKFANNLFTRLSGAKPNVKFNYLKAGFEIVGDHKQAAEAKKVFDYYKDIVTEIKLEALVDGSTRVGHGQPFGVFVNIRHTRDIERESGGFGRYLQNQNSMVYSYNYGRPTADYRDRFETAAKSALKEHFDVVSITFQDEKVHSRAAAEFGWRYTPYAYILLKPRGPQVDKIPPMRIDLDFLDTSGYVVLPVETAAVPIDCRDSAGDTRPLDKLTVTQTLDERQADKGILLLEVKAVGVGLVPPLKDLCEFAPAGFEITKTDDQGVAVKKFEEDADKNGVVTERIWTLTLKGQEGQSELPKSFTFGTVKVPTKESLFQRYADADLVTVEQTVPLEKTYGKEGRAPRWMRNVAIALVIGIIGLIIRLATWARRPKQTDTGLPADVDAFTVAALLRDAQTKPGLTGEQKAALSADLETVERYYFSADRNGDPPPNLRGMAQRWAAV